MIQIQMQQQTQMMQMIMMSVLNNSSGNSAAMMSMCNARSSGNTPVSGLSLVDITDGKTPEDEDDKE